MPGFQVEVQHSLGSETATERLRGFSSTIRETYRTEVTEVLERWTEDGRLEFSFKTSGMRISGNAIVEATTIRVEGTLPLAASFFRGAIERQIRDKLLEVISRTG